MFHCSDTLSFIERHDRRCFIYQDTDKGQRHKDGMPDLIGLKLVVQGLYHEIKSAPRHYLVGIADGILENLLGNKLGLDNSGIFRQVTFERFNHIVQGFVCILVSKRLVLAAFDDKIVGGKGVTALGNNADVKLFRVQMDISLDVRLFLSDCCEALLTRFSKAVAVWLLFALETTLPTITARLTRMAGAEASRTDRPTALMTHIPMSMVK